MIQALSSGTGEAQASPVLSPANRLRSIADTGFTWLAGAAAALMVVLGVGPRFLPYQTFAVLSGSMQPTIPVGAVIIDIPVASSSIKPGNIITFARPDRPSEMVTHRVVDVVGSANGGYFLTKGDANGTTDYWHVQATGTTLRTVFDLPWLGYPLVYMQTPLGRVITVILPAMILAFLFLQEIWRPRQPEAS